MYSGTTFTNKSGAILGAHQKIDRVAYAHLARHADTKNFPKLSAILHFEGKNGPDGIKRKSPAQDEPSHFYDPFDNGDSNLIELIQSHYKELVNKLKEGNLERAAFEASWLAHAIVDGLTPAHHHPYEKKMSELRGAEKGERDSIKSKLIIPGDGVAETIKKNWAMWGFSGLLSRHAMFEAGLAVLLAPISMRRAQPTNSDIQTLVEIGYEEVFVRAAKEIATLDMYERFHDTGWTAKLARDVRNHLGPIMIKTVCLIWYSAMRDAGLLRGKK